MLCKPASCHKCSHQILTVTSSQEGLPWVYCSFTKHLLAHRLVQAPYIVEGIWRAKQGKRNIRTFDLAEEACSSYRIWGNYFYSCSNRMKCGGKLKLGHLVHFLIQISDQIRSSFRVLGMSCISFRFRLWEYRNHWHDWSDIRRKVIFLWIRERKYPEAFERFQREGCRLDMARSRERESRGK